MAITKESSHPLIHQWKSKKKLKGEEEERTKSGTKCRDF